MSANNFGNRFVMTSFGESHGPAMGVVLDGVPSGVPISDSVIRSFLIRRRPGLHATDSQRGESDTFQILSGVFAGKTLGTPIAILVPNQNARPQDYSQIESQPRRGHADQAWKDKFGHTDIRGGGRSSGRETVSRVLAGAVASQVVRETNPELQVFSFVSQIGNLSLPQDLRDSFLSSPWKSLVALQNLDASEACLATRCPDPSVAENMFNSLLRAKEDGESFGGICEVLIANLPLGLGQPVFHKLKADLTSAMMSVGAVCAVELGSGVNLSSSKGSEVHSAQAESTHQDPYGGIQGGISTGRPILLKIHFKPTSSILDIAKKGRHDPCIVPRAAVVLESMVWAVLLDHLLWAKTDTIHKSFS